MRHRRRHPVADAELGLLGAGSVLLILLVGWLYQKAPLILILWACLDGALVLGWGELVRRWQTR